MADPLWINASGGAPAYAANEMRQAMALALMYDGRNLGGRAGVRPGGTQLKTELSGSTITVRTGICLIDPALSTAQGPYWVALPADETHTLSAAHATNPRKDRVVIRVYDHDEDSSGLRLARSEYIVGTPSPTPSAPAVPAGAMLLADIDVPQSGGGSAVVTDRRQFTASNGGIVPVSAAGDISASVAGRYRHRLDTNQLERDTGSEWIPIAPLVRRKANDEAISNNTTLHNDTELFITVADPNTVWSLDVFLRVLSHPNADIKLKWSVPSGTVITWLDVNTSRTELRETDTLTVQTTGPAENISLRGTVSVGATPGAIRLQWAQSASNAGVTAVQALSWMQMQRLP
ncbi:hypothetical protein AB0B85_11375 [Micromonospora sp. NPDC049044]|uniref:hypothetical protein n=1 Tax=Micromonospora sp. NPDC049044 TaxID=3154827 RepID=UPI0033E92FB8